MVVIPFPDKFHTFKNGNKYSISENSSLMALTLKRLLCRFLIPDMSNTRGVFDIVGTKGKTVNK